MSQLSHVQLQFCLIGALYMVALLADFWAPYGQNPFSTELSQKQQHPSWHRIPYAPPTKVHFAGNLYYHPLRVTMHPQTFVRQFEEIQHVRCDIDFFVPGSTYRLFGMFDTDRHLFGAKNCPYGLHLWGTDRLGRDYFSRFLFGLRPSLYSALLGLLIAFPIGIVYGTVAGYYRGALGDLMMRLVDVIMSMPSLYLLVVLAGLLPAALSNFQRLLLITVILAFIGWAGLARIVRGQVLSLVDREFVQAALIQGIPTWKILCREIIPQLSGYLVITLTISFPAYVLGETVLSFLGLGINQPDASLGMLLAEGKDLSNLFMRPWLAAVPIALLLWLGWSCNTLGDKLRDLCDPRTNLISD